MRSTNKVKIEITIVLTEEEARWLKGLVQNPIPHEPEEPETMQDRKIRESLWKCLNNI